MSSDEFQTQQGGSKTYPSQCGSLKKGSHVLLKGKPCKIVDIATSKTGKHGHAKANITGLDIFTNKKYEDCHPTSHNVDCPFVTKTDYELVSVGDDDYVTFIDKDGEFREDLKLPDDVDLQDMVAKLKSDLEQDKNLLITVVSAMGEEKIIAYRDDKNAEKASS